MAFTDLFKSDKTRIDELKKKQHRLELTARRGVRKLDESADDLERQRAELWSKAMQYVKMGQKSEAENLVRQHKFRGILLNKLQQQKFVVESRLTQFAIASTMNEIVQGVQDFAQSLQLDPGVMETNLDNIDTLLDDTEVTWDILGRAYDRDVRKMKSQGKTYAESDISSEMAALEREAAASLVGEGKATSAVNPERVVARDEINAGLKKINERLAKS